MLNTPDRSLEEWQIIGHETARSLAAQRRWFLLWKASRASATTALQQFIDLVYGTNIEHFSESQFATAEEILNDVIDRTEKYLATDASRGEYAFLGEGIRQLRDARFWIKQGLSPDASKRPSDDERRQRASDHAATVWAGLVS